MTFTVVDVAGNRVDALTESEVNAKVSDIKRAYTALSTLRNDLERIQESRIQWDSFKGHRHDPVSGRLVRHTDLIDVGTGDHHAKLHAADHAAAGLDDIGGKNMTITGNWDVTGITGRVKIQTGAGAPVHTEAEGTLYWDTTANALYANDNGAAAWTQIGTTPSAHAVLSTTHNDSLAAVVVRGDILRGNATPAWSRLAVGAAGRIFSSNGTDPDWSQRNLDLGGFYADVSQIAAPANPGAGIRRLYVDSGTGKISVRTTGGSSVSLEEQGGGADHDHAAPGDGGKITGGEVDTYIVFAEQVLDPAGLANTARLYSKDIAGVTKMAFVDEAGLVYRLHGSAPTGNIDIGDGAVAGSSRDFSDAAHQHAFPAPGAGYAVDVAAAEDDGVASTPARSDHQHAHGTGYLPDAHHQTTYVGTATLDFGAFPGKSDASVSVTGQTGIASTSIVQAWIYPKATADHTADEHAVESLKVFARDIVVGAGFTVQGVNTSEINEKEPPQFLEFGTHHPDTFSEGKGTRLYGTWSIAWMWQTPGGI